MKFKRLISLFMVLVLCVSLAACGKKDGADADSAINDSSKNTTTSGGADAAGSQTTAGGADATGSQTTAGGADAAGSRTTADGADAAGSQTTAGGTDAAGSRTTAGGTDAAGSTAAIQEAVGANPAITPEILKVLSAYEKKLKDYVNVEFEGENYAFGLGLVDKDDIPELLIANSECHAAGVQVYKYFGENDIRYVGEYGEYGSFSYDPRCNVIYSFYMGMGIIELAIFSIDGSGKSVLIDSFRDDMNGDEEVYSVNNVVTDADTYNEKLDKYYATEDFTVSYSDLVCSDEVEGESDRMQILKGMYIAALRGEIYEKIDEGDTFKFDIYDYDSGVKGTFTVEEEKCGMLKRCYDYEKNDGTICFELQEYITISSDDPDELKLKYNLPLDLNGYDYECVELDTDPIIVYGSQWEAGSEMAKAFGHGTDYVLLDYSHGVNSREADYEAFTDRVENSYSGLYVTVHLEEKNGEYYMTYAEETYNG